MGAASNGMCFDSPEQAANAACATQYPRALDSGAFLSCSGVAPGAEPEALVLLLSSATPASAPTAYELEVTFPYCNGLERIEDLGNVFGLGLAALAVVWCTKQFVLRLITDR